MTVIIGLFFVIVSGVVPRGTGLVGAGLILVVQAWRVRADRKRSALWVGAGLAGVIAGCVEVADLQTIGQRRFGEAVSIAVITTVMLALGVVGGASRSEAVRFVLWVGVLVALAVAAVMIETHAGLQSAATEWTAIASAVIVTCVAGGLLVVANEATWLLVFAWPGLAGGLAWVAIYLTLDAEGQIRTGGVVGRCIARNDSCVGMSRTAAVVVGCSPLVVAIAFAIGHGIHMAWGRHRASNTTQS